LYEQLRIRLAGRNLLTSLAICERIEKGLPQAWTSPARLLWWRRTSAKDRSMVSFSFRGSSFACSGVAIAAALLLAGCQTGPPVLVNSTLVATDAFSARSPKNVAVLPVEDGTADGAAQRHLVFLRQEVMRQMVDRLFAPLSPNVVDAGLRGVAGGSAKESLLTPATLQRMSGHSNEDAVFALRVDRWDESNLVTAHKIWFQFQAVLVGVDQVQLWSGTIQGEVKAGGAGAAPRDRDGMARSCGTLAVQEMMSRLPKRTQ
jgi:hypothetical protein